MDLKRLFFISFACLALTCCKTEQDNTPRITEDFNFDWKFHLGDVESSQSADFPDNEWTDVRLPHDWSIEVGYQQENTAASTGFVPGGIGWYRKKFKLFPSDEGKIVSVMFDGVYNNSSVWINGHLLGTRPYGYSTFSYDLTDHLVFDGTDNVIAVKVDRTTYVDSRWYSGSGIYRKVQLIKTAPLHVAQWGVQITTPSVSEQLAEVNIKTKLQNDGAEDLEEIVLNYTISGPNGMVVAQAQQAVASSDLKDNNTKVQIAKPKLWSIDTPSLYTLHVKVLQKGNLVDETSERFGIRTFNFDADKGFSLNGEWMKIKGVNLHHDAGAVGAAVPKGIWVYRIEKLKSIGVNAVRLSHNPHAVELMEVCDEMGMLVMAEAFDEWSNPKGKSLVYVGDNAAPKEAARAYPEVFNKWAEKDLKDLILRDFNHPSVIMWSIGNEIEWTFPYYAKTYTDVNGKREYYAYSPNYDSLTIKTAFDKNTGGVDSLALTSKRLADWVKEMDTSRPVTAGSVHPSIALASGYAQTLDVLGFNYRAIEYDAAHEAYPDLKILGSENWGAYSEWKNCLERDFVAGIFAWTGFAYLGEAGPWPRKGLEISFFDYAGFKTPRGHFFECLWIDTPKVYTVTTPTEESEYSYTKDDDWKFDINYYKPPYWAQLRHWEWYKVYPKWKYTDNEPIVVQTYTNCEEAELFLNGSSLGKQKRSDFGEDNIIKWLVPYSAGELKVVGYNGGEKATEYSLNTNGKVAKIILNTSKSTLNADGYEVAVVTAELLDENGILVTDADQEIAFDITGEINNIGVDNGWERYVGSHKSTTIKTHQGKAIVILQATKKQGTVSISATSEGASSEALSILVK
ncbi:glycoside hydrolase family 2 TIM barrel-domain containing protein [Flammeovirgaceae bacterium SG7u.111]|nr:glycoside hydrolase family 2 TIM barrel-domain containing protein [Flammeovirgaceae bacterium SG7u.132]WPO34238.1 glycoside hydrolase family 2 TIM barrel-domain containing protein [Flammeovirgaceae bacterium SG7u.111]